MADAARGEENAQSAILATPTEHPGTCKWRPALTPPSLGKWNEVIEEIKFDFEICFFPLFFSTCRASVFAWALCLMNSNRFRFCCGLFRASSPEV